MIMIIIKMNNNNPHHKSEKYKVLSPNTDFVGTNIMMNTIFAYKKSPLAEQILQEIHLKQNQIYQDFPEYIN
ncbi:putative ORfan [Saudi moumouvirus]|nr:putative ORfan [Saudi moumouvirus]